MNLCCSCHLDFGSVAAFDAHRVGKHAYTYREGLYLDPPVEDGRRCLALDEMLKDSQFVQNSRGRYSLSAALKSAHEAFSGELYSSQGHENEEDAA